MKLLLVVLAGLVLAEEKKGKMKTPMVCNGKEDEDHLTCKELSKEDCAKDDKCMFGVDRVMDKTNKMKTCLAKKKIAAPTPCTEETDCFCGQKCYFHEWMNKKLCTMCADHGIKEDCDAAADSMGCKWLEKGEEGMCVQGKDACNELAKGDCMKQPGDKCVYDKKKKTCSVAFKSGCVGKIEDNHHLCYEAKTKDACMAIVKKTILGSSQMCNWGYNKFEKESKHMKCMEDTKFSMGSTCNSQADCRCGTTCVELDFGTFKLSSCTLCKDFGVKADCTTEAAMKMGCKWVGDDDKGLCLKSGDMCSPMYGKKEECNAKKLCLYQDDNDNCAMKPVTKSTCKMLSKKKKGEEVDMEMMKNSCQMVPECSWNEKKNKCFYRK